LKKEEFMQQIKDCKLPEIFDQNLLDNASAMGTIDLISDVGRAHSIT